MDPVQHRLIPAHVTLCRDDELAGISTAELSARVATMGQPPLTLQFGPGESFDEHGVLLPCIAGQEAYHRLRVALLRSEGIQHSRAHITIAHPRNPRAPWNLPSTYEALAAPLSITFTKVSLIEQEAGEPWQILDAGNLVLGAGPPLQTEVVKDSSKRFAPTSAGSPRCCDHSRASSQVTMSAITLSRPRSFNRSW